MRVVSDTEPPSTKPEPDLEEEITLREINQAALKAYKETLAVYGNKDTPRQPWTVLPPEPEPPTQKKGRPK